MNQRLIKLLEDAGITVSKSDAGVLSDLNEIPEHISEALDKISNPYGKELYLKYCSTPENHKYIRRFVHTVLLRNGDSASWQKGRVLIPETSLEDLLTKSLSEIYGEFTPSIHLVRDPYEDSFEMRRNAIPCFVIRQENTTYASSRIEDFMSLPISTLVIEIQPSEIPIYHRRWIANRIGLCLQSDDLLESFSDISVLDRYAKRNKLTKDAIIAFQGLKQEKELGAWETSAYFGYVGDDSLYT